MTSGNLTWDDAVIRVLQDAGKPLHYTEVGDRIAEQGLTRSVGATPANSANVALNKLAKSGIIEKVGRGVFAISEVARQITDVDSDDDNTVVSDIGRLTVNAYGLYWDRNSVDWEATTNNRQLLGAAGGIQVNFADQDGIYLLHNGNEITYVGKSRTPNAQAGLYSRLKFHHTDRRKTDRWDTFSWFGFKPVNENGELLPTPESATIGDVIDILEAILIEGLMPRLNMRSGDGAREWLKGNQYFQDQSPAVIARRLAALAQIGQVLR